MSFYYLNASLPMLSLESPPPFSFAHFLDLCRQHLAPAEIEAVTSLEGFPGAPLRNSFLRAWRNADTAIRNAVARVRAARTKRDPLPHIREQEGWDVAIEKSVADAFSRETVAERELALDQLRWNIAEDLAGYDPFTLDTLLSYGIRLKLSERWAAMKIETGEQNVETILGRTLEKSHTVKQEIR